jgi:hypothetical protein
VDCLLAELVCIAIKRHYLVLIPLFWRFRIQGDSDSVFCASIELAVIEFGFEPIGSHFSSDYVGCHFFIHIGIT